MTIVLENGLSNYVGSGWIHGPQIMVITSKTSDNDKIWKELRIRFALFPKVLDDGKIIWFKPYQEVWVCTKEQYGQK